MLQATTATFITSTACSTNRTIKDATVRAFYYASADELKRHLHAFLLAYNCARRLKTLKTLKGKTPYKFICGQWLNEPERFKINPHHNSGTKHQGPEGTRPVEIPQSAISCSELGIQAGPRHVHVAAQCVEAVGKPDIESCPKAITNRQAALTTCLPSVRSVNGFIIRRCGTRFVSPWLRCRSRAR
jgi:hypothetical protein